MGDLGQDPTMVLNKRLPITAVPENECRNIFNDIVAEENVFQFIGSANARTTTARKATAKTNASQCLGGTSNTTLK